MFDKFGEFDSAEEINRAAAAQLKEGDLDAIKTIAEENGLDPEDAEDFCTGAIDSLTTPLLAAIGKLEMESKDLGLKNMMEAVFGEFNVIEVESEEVIDSVIGWHYEVIPTDALSKCEPFCYPMPLTDFHIKANKMEVIGNMFDNPELLEEV